MSSRTSNSVIVAIEYYYVDVHSIYSEHQRRHILKLIQCVRDTYQKWYSV